MDRIRWSPAAIVALAATALVGCTDEEPVAIGAAPLTLAWASPVDMAPIPQTHLDAKGGLLLRHQVDELARQRLTRLAPDGREDWTLSIEGGVLVDVEATENGFVMLADVAASPATRIGGVPIDPGTLDPGRPISAVFDVTLDGAVERVQLWQADTGFFVARHVGARGDGGRILGGTLFGTLTVDGAPVESEQGATVLVTTSPDGSLETPIEIGVVGGASLQDLAVDPTTGETFVIGTFNGTVDIGGETLAKGPSGANATYVARFAADGSLRWVEHCLGGGGYDARALPDGQVLLKGLVPRGSFPIQIDGEVLSGPFAVRIDADGDVVDAVSLGVAVASPFHDQIEDGRTIQAAYVDLSREGHVTMATTSRTLHERDTGLGYPMWVHDDDLTIQHRGTDGAVQTLLQQSFTDDAFFPSVGMHTRPDGAVLVVLHSKQPIDFGAGAQPGAAYVALYQPSSLETP